MIDSEEPSLPTPSPPAGRAGLRQAGKRFSDNRGVKRGVIIHTIRLRHIVKHFSMLLGDVEISLNRYNNAFLRVIGVYHVIGKQLRSPIWVKQMSVVVIVLFATTLFSVHYSFAEEGFAAFNLRGTQKESQNITDLEQAEDGTADEEVDISASSQEAEVADEQEASVLRTYRVPVTAYSSTPDQTWGNPYITASGTRVRSGTIAANFLPLGTKVRIPEYYGDKIFVVEDRMHSRYWHRADIWMETRHEALQWGMRYATIEVVQ